MSEGAAVAAAGAEPRARGVLLETLGDGALLGSVGALAWAGPAAQRVAGEGVGFVAAYAAAVGAGALTLGAILAAGRAARPWRRSILVLGLGLALATGPLAWLGALLESSTHHRPLGGVTFALLGGAGGLLCIAVVARLSAVSRAGGRAGRAARVGLGLACSGSLGATLVAALRAASEAQGLGAGLFDGAFGLALVLGGLRMRQVSLPPWGRPAALVVWASLVGGAVGFVGSDRALGEALARRAPVVLGAAGALR